MSRRLLAVSLLLCALALGACGLGDSGVANDDVSLLVTSDFGATSMNQIGPAPTEGSDTILSLLRSSLAVGMSPKGAVASIDDVGASAGQGWRFYVNGIGARDDASKVQVAGGDRIWWDRHDTKAAPEVHAVVGSYPEPFVHGQDGKRWTLRVECVRNLDKTPCNDVATRLTQLGVIPGQSLVGADGGEDNQRVLVGPWSGVGVDRAARLLDGGPRVSGVFARFSPDGRHLSLLDPNGRVTRTLGPGTGLVAATRYKDEPPTWFVTGTDVAGVNAAARALDQHVLARHFAVALSGGHAIALPDTAGAATR
jgi:Domain of unknown function (DUF4430)